MFLGQCSTLTTTWRRFCARLVLRECEFLRPTPDSAVLSRREGSPPTAVNRYGLFANELRRQRVALPLLTGFM